MHPMPDADLLSDEGRVLDLRGLEPPEPLLRVLAALDAAPDQPLRARFPREPFPLYAVLQAGGWTHQTVSRSDGCVDILISRKV